MKVAFIASTYPRYDEDVAVPWLRQEVRALAERGHEIVVFAPSYKGQKSHMLDGVRVERFRYFLASKEDLTHDSGAPSKVHKLGYFALAAFYVLRGTLAFTVLQKKEKFDIVHVHWPFPHANFLRLIERNRKFGVVLNFHGAELALAKKYGFVRRNLGKAVQNSDAVITNSQFTEKKVKEAVGETSIDIIPFGCPIEMNTVPERSGSDTPKILFVGRFIERKGIEYLIDAFDLIRKECAAELLIVGSGFLEESLAQKIDEMALGESVKLMTRVGNDEIAELYASASVFVLPAIIDSKGDTEGLGVVLIEALTFGLPVVASNVGGIPDVIIDGKTGLLVPEKSPVLLKEAILKVLRNPELATRLVAEGQAHILSEFSWKSVIDKVEHLYDRVRANPR